MTIPKRVRDAAHLKCGDVVALEVRGERVMMRKVLQQDVAYLKAVEGTLDEWNSPEDEEAWRDL